MLRISLIVVIVAGIAALAISQLKVADKIKTLTEERNKFEQDWKTSQEAERAAKKRASEATATADKAKKELDTAKIDLGAAIEKADQQERRANELESRLTKTTQERNESQAELARWKAFNMSVEQIRAMIAENKKLVQERDAVGEENKVLARKVIVLQNRIKIYEGENVKVELPVGLKGKVVAVDPKYEFIVLNIGEKDQVLERGEMLVSRSGKLVAKVRILTVQPNRSIANVLPDWKQAEILEGDDVIVGL